MLEAPPTTIRTNTLRVGRDALAVRLADRAPRPAPLTSHGLILDRPGALWNTEAFAEGLFEAQDAGSQLIAELVAPPPGGRVLDACAGAGGKTLALAGIMGGKGRIIATDTAHEKLDALRDRARRAGATNVQVVTHEVTGTFDRILVDAPCTGSGTWRRNPEAKLHSEARGVAELAALQLEIAAQVVPLLAPGGRLVYATCSLFPEENQEVVAALRTRFPELAPVRIAEIHGKAWAEPLVDDTGCAIALRPDRHGTDGFYAAVLRKPR
jgi:16S rRNA (cytosine967-C5)-methyltransferase